MNNKKHKTESNLIDKRQTKKVKTEIIKSFSSPHDTYTNVDIIKRNEDSIFYQITDQKNLDMDEFEIFKNEKSTKTTKGISSIDRYIDLSKISDKIPTFIQGFIKTPNNPYTNKLVVIKIADYCLQYGNKEEWSIWVKTPSGAWVRLRSAFRDYSKIYARDYYIFLMVMHTTSFFEQKGTELTLQNLFSFLENLIPQFQRIDLVAYRTIIFHHVPDFLNNGSITKPIAEELAMEAKINSLLTKEPIYSLLGKFRTPDFSYLSKLPKLPEEPHSEIDKNNQNWIKEVKLLKKEMAHCDKKEVRIPLSLFPKGMIQFYNYEAFLLFRKETLHSGYLGTQLPDVNSTVDSEFNFDVFPFLVCPICNLSKHVLIQITDDHIKLNKEVLESFEEYIEHLEKHHNEILKSLSVAEKSILGNREIINQLRIRTFIETIHELSDMPKKLKPKISKKKPLSPWP